MNGGEPPFIRTIKKFIHHRPAQLSQPNADLHDLFLPQSVTDPNVDRWRCLQKPN